MRTSPIAASMASRPRCTFVPGESRHANLGIEEIAMQTRPDLADPGPSCLHNRTLRAVAHLRGTRPRPVRIGKHVHVSERRAFQVGRQFLEVRFTLAWESDDEVGADRVAYPDAEGPL